jgi:hypothetical protein
MRVRLKTALRTFTAQRENGQDIESRLASVCWLSSAHETFPTTRISILLEFNTHKDHRPHA